MLVSCGTYEVGASLNLLVNSSLPEFSPPLYSVVGNSRHTTEHLRYAFVCPFEFQHSLLSLREISPALLEGGIFVSFSGATLVNVKGSLDPCGISAVCFSGQCITHLLKWFVWPALPQRPDIFKDNSCPLFWGMMNSGSDSAILVNLIPWFSPNGIVYFDSIGQ